MTRSPLRLLAAALLLVACGGTSFSTGGDSSGGKGATGGASAAGAGPLGGASNAGGTGGAMGTECRTNSDCPQTNCYMCPSSICVSGRCVSESTAGTGGASGASGAGGTAGRGSGGSGGVALAGGAGGGPASGGIGGSAASGGTAGQPASGGAPGKPCRDASNAWVPEVKACKVDADCIAIPTYSCCGPGPVYGLAKAAQETYPACFVVSHPVNCPPLGCASQTSTEDGQQVGYTTDVVVTRCVDVAGGARACYTTAKGACSHNVTRCVAGDTCTNECGAPCKCENGYMNCALPSGSCAAQQNIIPGCRYLSAPAATSATYCQCSLDTHGWICQG